MKRDYEALSQRHQEEGVENDALHNNGSATSEIFKIKDHLISVERKVRTILFLFSAGLENLNFFKVSLNQDKSQKCHCKAVFKY